MGSVRQSLCIAAIVGTAIGSPAFAQDDARARLLIPDSGLVTEVGHFPRGAPGTSTGSPIGFGADWGDIYLGFGFQAPARFAGPPDGSATIGLGFGDAEDLVGLDVGFTSLSTVRTALGHRMAVSGKLHKDLPRHWGLAVGVTTVYLNDRPPGTAPSLYGVISKLWDLPGTGNEALTLSVGAGTGDFRLEPDILSDRQTVGVFGSLSLRMSDQFAVIVDWPGQDLDFGFSIVPFRKFPIVLTPAVVDITGTAGTHHFTSGIRPRFSLGAGMAVKF
jgi:hypothetical protein